MLRQPHLHRKWRPVRLTWSCARSSWPRSMQRSSVAPSLLSSLVRPLLSSMERRNEEAVDVVALVHDGNPEIAGRESAEGRRRAVSVFVGDSVTRCGPSLSATPSAPCLYIECAQASRHFYVCIYSSPGGHVWIRLEPPWHSSPPLFIRASAVLRVAWLQPAHAHFLWLWQVDTAPMRL